MKRFAKASDIKVGVIGYGGAFNMGPHHLNSMKDAGMTPTAVAEIDEARLAVAAKDFPGIETYSSVAAMLKKSDVNLVVIITPHNTHAKIAVQCLNAGRHVVCEKPFAITTEECDAMIGAANRNKVMISAFHNRHWDGCVVQAVKTIRSGAIGEVIRVGIHMGGYGCPGAWWRSSKTISGGILYDWGVHMLEYALQIVRSDLQEVTGFAHRGFWASKCAWKKDTNEDEACAIARFASGQWINLLMSSIDCSPRKPWLEVVGTKGAYVMEHENYELITPQDGKTITTKGRNPDGDWHRYYRNVRDHLVKGTPLVITGEWARRPIHIIDLACRSAAKGCAIKAWYK